ncbi:MAG: hypothetical protein HUJ80_00550 [Firmicutes bacterium]|nr:hypothetical protein [Bacillota bacterium]
MIYAASNAPLPVLSYLKTKDQVTLTGPLSNVDPSIACHPDLIFCDLGPGSLPRIFRGDPTLLTPRYPGDCRYNAAVVGSYIICRPQSTDPALLAAAKRQIESRRQTAQLLGVKQGYTKCNLAVLDEAHVITEDRGIARALQHSDISCLLIGGGFVQLPGHPCGFIGGACGRVGRELIFAGDLTVHPDAAAITRFVKSCGLVPVWFSGIPLTDVGSILWEPSC